MNNRLTIEIIYNECDLKQKQIEDIIEGSVKVLHEVGEDVLLNGPYVLGAIAKCEPVVGA